MGQEITRIFTGTAIQEKGKEGAARKRLVKRKEKGGRDIIIIFSDSGVLIG